MTTTTQATTTPATVRDTDKQAPRDGAYPQWHGSLWRDLLSPAGWTPQPDSPAVRAMLADSYDENGHMVCLDHGVVGCRPCGLVTP